MKCTKNYALVAALLACVCCGGFAEAGRVNGPGVNHSRVEAYSTDRYIDAFQGGEVTQIVIEGDGDTDLDLYVYDENGNLIASDTDRLDVCVVRFVPKWTGSFRIVIKNLGSVYNEYVLVTT